MNGGLEWGAVAATARLSTRLEVIAGCGLGLIRERKFQRDDCESEMPWLSVIYRQFSARPASPRENDLSLKLRS